MREAGVSVSEVEQKNAVWGDGNFDMVMTF